MFALIFVSTRPAYYRDREKVQLAVMPVPLLTLTLTMKMTSAAQRRTVVKVTNAAEYSSSQTL